MNSTCYLEEKNIKSTKARVCVLDILVEKETPMSAEEIFELCKENNLNINRSTVYRALETFVEKGFVNKFDFGKGKYSYIFKDRGHKHTIKCQFCDNEVEYDCIMPQIKEMLEKETGYTLLTGDIKLKAVCEKCKHKTEKIKK